MLYDCIWVSNFNVVHFSSDFCMLTMKRPNQNNTESRLNSIKPQSRTITEALKLATWRYRWLSHVFAANVISGRHKLPISSDFLTIKENSWDCKNDLCFVLSSLCFCWIYCDNGQFYRAYVEILLARQEFLEFKHAVESLEIGGSTSEMFSCLW